MAITPFDPQTESARDYAKRLSQSILNPGATTGGDVQGTSSEQAKSNEWASSGTQFSDPQLAVGGLAQQGGLIGTLAPAYQQFLESGTHPLIESVIPGILAQNEPAFRGQQRDLADQFRMAGNTASSAYQKEAGKLGAQQYGQELGQISNIISTLYPQIAGAYQAPISQADQLINALKLQQQQSTGSSSSSASSSTPYFAPQSGGGGMTGPSSVSFQGSSIAPFQDYTSPRGVRSSPNPYITGPSSMTEVPSGSSAFSVDPFKVTQGEY